MKKTCLLLCLPLFTFLAFSSEAPDRLSKFSPSTFIIEAAKLGETMNDEQFMYYSFLFSGVSEKTVPIYMQKYTTLATKLSSELAKNNLNAYDSGEYILDFLHTNLFISYREFITDLDVLFDKGFYNCVSSSIVYYALAMRVGLPVIGIKTSDHAFCAIALSEQIIDVETTSIYGFNPGEKKEFANSFGQTGFVYTPPSNYSDRRNIAKLETLSLIMQNRIVELYKTQDYEKIVSLVINIHALLQTEASFNNIINEFGNYVSFLSNKKQFAQGLDFLIQARTFYGNVPQFSEFAGVLFNNGIASRISSRVISHVKTQLPDAQAFFDKYSTEKIVPQHMVKDIQSILDEAKIRVFIEERKLNDSIAEIKKIYTEGRINKNLYNDFIMFVYSNEINQLMKQRNWQSALNLAHKTLSDVINDTRANKQLETIEYNIGAHYHNEFAKLYNSKRYKEAEQTINEGLSLIPNHSYLISDKKRLDSMQIN